MRTSSTALPHAAWAALDKNIIFKMLMSMMTEIKKKKKIFSST
jgi:hypothetical protein